MHQAQPFVKRHHAVSGAVRVKQRLDTHQRRVMTCCQHAGLGHEGLQAALRQSTHRFNGCNAHASGRRVFFDRHRQAAGQVLSQVHKAGGATRDDRLDLKRGDA